jgi:hypothetical protein
MVVPEPDAEAARHSPRHPPESDGAEHPTAERNASPPVVVDLGSASAKRIRKLKRGTGKLQNEVQDVMAQIRAEMGVDAAGKHLVPVVVVYSRKKKRARSILDLPLR